MCTCLDITNVLPAGLYTTWAVATVQTLPVSVMRFTLRGGGRNRVEVKFLTQVVKMQIFTLKKDVRP